MKAVKICKQIGELLGLNNAEELDLRFEEAKAAVVETFFDSSTGSFCGEIQGADAFAVDIGIDDGRAYHNLTKKYSALNRFDTGIFGTEILIRVLCEHGDTALAKALLTSRAGLGTFSYMREHGATTLWEYWGGSKSRSHPMFGAVVSTIIKYL